MSHNTVLPAGPAAENKLLDVFAGKWRTEGQTIANGASPAVTLNGLDTYEWLPGGYFLVHHVAVRMGNEDVSAIEIIGYDNATQTFPIRYFDNQGHTGLMNATVRDHTWTFTGEQERGIFTFSNDGNTLTGSWEHLNAVGEWVHWMDVKLTREK